MQKRGCHDYFRGEKKRKLREAMFQGNTNDPCLPKQYKVKKGKEIWDVRYAPFEPKPASYAPCSRPLAHRCPLQAAGTPEIFEGNMAELRANEVIEELSSEDEDEDAE